MDALLEIDLGNSRLKWRRLAADGGVVERGDAPGTPLPDLRAAVGPGLAGGARICSVAGEAADEALRDALAALGVSPIRFARSGAVCGRLRAGYREPARMGVDRWVALAAGAAALDGPFAVLDAGTALTLDLVDADGGHLGGWILPGLQLMRSSLLASTAGVRFPEPPSGSIGPGRDTAEAVGYGTVLMARDFVAARMDAFRARQPQAPLLVTGGDGPLLAADCAGPVRVVPELVLDGLAVVLGP